MYECGEARLQMQMLLCNLTCEVDATFGGFAC
jgi:hypothetical protein